MSATPFRQACQPVFSGVFAPMRDGGGGSAAALAVMAGAGLLGLSPLAVRFSELGPQATAFWRFAFALPILLLLMRGGRPKPDPSPSGRQVSLLLLAGVFFGLDIALWSAALDFTTVANATLLSNMTPVFAAAFAWFEPASHLHHTFFSATFLQL